MLSVPELETRGKELFGGALEGGIAAHPKVDPRTGLHDLRHEAAVPRPWRARVEHLHTVGTSPAMVHGASLVLVGSREAGRALGLSPRARVLSHAAVGSDPVTMLTAPATAARRALARAGRDVRDVGLFECNESFAATVLRFEAELGVDPARVNVAGGAIAMGHPLGATGGILTATLLDEMARADVELGVVAMCAGMGLGAATVFARAPEGQRRTIATGTPGPTMGVATNVAWRVGLFAGAPALRGIAEPDVTLARVLPHDGRVGDEIGLVRLVGDQRPIGTLDVERALLDVVARRDAA